MNIWAFSYEQFVSPMNNRNLVLNSAFTSSTAVLISLLLLGHGWGLGLLVDWISLLLLVWVRACHYPVAHSRNQIHSVLGAVSVPQRGTDFSTFRPLGFTCLTPDR